MGTVRRSWRRLPVHKWSPPTHIKKKSPSADPSSEKGGHRKKKHGTSTTREGVTTKKGKKKSFQSFLCTQTKADRAAIVRLEKRMPRDSPRHQRQEGSRKKASPPSRQSAKNPQEGLCREFIPAKKNAKRPSFRGEKRKKEAREFPNLKVETILQIRRGWNSRREGSTPSRRGEIEKKKAVSWNPLKGNKEPAKGGKKCLPKKDQRGENRRRPKKCSKHDDPPNCREIEGEGLNTQKKGYLGDRLQETPPSKHL